MHSRGLSLIELLTALVIAAILVNLSLSNLPEWIAKSALEKDRDHFAALIYLGRSAAIDLNYPVILCPGSVAGCAARNTWHEGTLLFADVNRNGEYDRGDTMLAGVDELSSRIEWRSFRNRGYLRFLPTGLTDWQNGHFKFCSLRPGADAKALQLVLNAAGRMYFSRDEDDDGWHEDVQGRDLVC